MAGVFAENFGWYTGTQILRYWTTGGNAITGPYGRGGGSGLRFSGDFTDFVAIDLAGRVSGATCIAGFDFRISSYPGSANVIFGANEGGTIQWTAYLNTNGTISFYRGLGVSLLGTTTYVVPLDEHIYLNPEVVIGNSGSVRLDVYEDGDSAAQVVLNVSGVDTMATANATWDEWSLGAASNGVTDFSNLILLDGSGARNNARLGPCDVRSCLPNGAGFHQEMTPNEGIDHVTRVNQATADDDITTLDATSTGLDETFEFEDAPFPNRTIAFSVLIAVAKKSGSGSLKLAARQGVTDTLGSDQVLTDDYVAYWGPYQTAPDGTPWTPAVWNPMQWGGQSA